MRQRAEECLAALRRNGHEVTAETLQQEIEWWESLLKQARDAFDSLYATEHKRHSDLHAAQERINVLEEISQRLLVAWNGGIVYVRPDLSSAQLVAVVDAFNDLRKALS